MGWPFPFAKRAIRMRCVTDESRKVSSVILQKYQRHNILQKAEYLSRVSLPMNDPIPPRPRAAITGDSRLGTHGSSRPPASRPRQHAHHHATARAVPTAGHRGPRYASTFFIARRGEAGVAACRPAPGAIGGSSPWNPPACARGTSCPHPRRHPAAAPSARHLPTFDARGPQRAHSRGGLRCCPPRPAQTRGVPPPGRARRPRFAPPHGAQLLTHVAAPNPVLAHLGAGARRRAF